MHYGYGYFEEERLKKSSDLRLWRRIMIYTLPRWPEVTAAIVLSLLITGSSLALPHLVRLAIDNFITVELAPNVEVAVQRQAVSTVLPKGTLKAL